MDINSLRERPSAMPMSVSDLNAFIKNMFDSSRMLSAVTVVGEISNFVSHRSGHLYFSVKDSDSQIRAVMFRPSAFSLRFVPENGMRVILRGSVTVYQKDGSYQLYVKNMQPDGIGALHLAYEQLKERLLREGIFDTDKKKPIPAYPERIGVITSPTGAAVRDIINVATRRYPLAAIYIYPALVQGDGAEASLIKALDYFDSSRLVDTVIIGRGGGSIEELWAFNSELLARRIYSMSIPVISAVGHETDFTICDFAADLRAPTPSAAAELATPDIRELGLALINAQDRCDRALLRSVDRLRVRLERAKSSPFLLDPHRLIGDKQEQVDKAKDSAYRAAVKICDNERSRMIGAIAKLDALNPLGVLQRGYSIVEGEMGSVHSVNELSDGDKVTIRLTDGAVGARIIK